ncbi:hypothetical protein PZ895_00600 [Mesorhizobium sp. YIM 152430]|uniref:antitoxin VbhA family protein n=1 Tax=Mesorhizobium sp. YIM 152430 TaxID=3031761 RepID=UPI0023DC7FA9|nr:hypothetical protein [Mesorhizobium sp. YIM 152430]MDF1598276.1 hypothetical protein [Mesorhizobium sp. YIM 152430]
MIVQHSKLDTCLESIGLRRRANNEARAANIRAGYVIDPRHEADMERYVAGEVTLDQLREESLARHRQPQPGARKP